MRRLWRRYAPWLCVLLLTFSAAQGQLLIHTSRNVIGSYNPATGELINPALVPSMGTPRGLFVDPAGDLIIRSNFIISRIDSVTGALVDREVVPEIQGMTTYTLDKNGTLFVKMSDGSIRTYDTQTGELINPALVTGLVNFGGMTTDGQGNLYLRSSTAIAKLDADTGQVINPELVVVGKSDGGFGKMRVDNDGHLLISRYVDYISKFDAETGALIDKAFITPAQLRLPSGPGKLNDFALDGNGNLFVLRSAGTESRVGVFDAETGATINDSLITLTFPSGHAAGGVMVIVPEPSGLIIPGILAAACLSRRRRSHLPIQP